MSKIWSIGHQFSVFELKINKIKPLIFRRLLTLDVLLGVSDFDPLGFMQDKLDSRKFKLVVQDVSAEGDQLPVSRPALLSLASLPPVCVSVLQVPKHRSSSTRLQAIGGHAPCIINICNSASLT